MHTDKIVILGGTFDPIHNGHMQMANRLYEIFATPIILMPTGIPPYKAPPEATNLQRLSMLKLALNGNPRFHIDTREIDSPVYCYTQKTLSRLRQEAGKNIPIYFLIGEDSLCTLDTWDNWEDLLQLANIVVAWRDGYTTANIKSEKLTQLFEQNSSHDFNDLTYPQGKFYILDFTPQNVSSTHIRALVKNHQGISDLVPPAIAAYIKQQQLYLK